MRLKPQLNTISLSEDESKVFVYGYDQNMKYVVSEKCIGIIQALWWGVGVGVLRALNQQGF